MDDSRNEQDEEHKDLVGKSVVGILHALKTNTPIDMALFKAMHKGTDFEKHIKARPNVHDDGDRDFDLHIEAINDTLRSLNMELVPYWEPDLIAYQNKRELGDNTCQYANLGGFFVKNNIADQNLVEEYISVLTKLGKEDMRNSEDQLNQVKMLNDEIKNMKKCHLLDPQGQGCYDMHRLLTQLVLAFIFTRSYELGDLGQFYNSEDPLKCYVTLRDLFRHLDEVFGLSVPSDVDKEGAHDIRFHAGQKQKGYIKNFVTQVMKKHRYIKLNECEQVRDAMLYDDDGSVNGRIQVMWDARAICEFDIEELLTGISLFVQETGNPEWQQDKAFGKAVKLHMQACSRIKNVAENIDIRTILKAYR